MPAAVKAESHRRWRTVHDDAGLPLDLAPLEPPPCDDCPHRSRCAAGLACAAFGRYLERGREDYWCHAPREPSAELFALMEALPQRGGVRPKGQTTLRHW
jgi:hypothetical protein